MIFRKEVGISHYTNFEYHDWLGKQTLCRNKFFILNNVKVSAAKRKILELMNGLTGTRLIKIQLE